MLAGIGESPALEERLRAENVEVAPLHADPGSPEDATQTVALARQQDAAWIAADGYHFDAAYQKAIKDAGLCLLALDDYGHANHYCADLVLNQNLHAAEALYARREPYTRLLLGTRYALLRREFRTRRSEPRQTPAIARRVLVTLGGSDPDNVTGEVIRALGQVDMDGLEVVIVAGGSNPHYEALRTAVSGAPRAIRLLRNVQNMPERMVWADMAVLAGGSTCWEAAFLGLPSLLLVLADNQRAVAEGMEAEGAARSLGRAETVSPDQIADALTQMLWDAPSRERMSRRGQTLVDGNGAGRVARAMAGRGLHLRPARDEDCRMLWEWANDSEVRAVSFSSEPIPWERHLVWFRAKREDPACVLLIATTEDGTPVGQARFDVAGDAATLSISLDVAFRGKGYGAEIIASASSALFDAVNGVSTIHAYVKPDNAASCRVFIKAGWEDCGKTVLPGGQRAIRFAHQRSKTQ